MRLKLKDDKRGYYQSPWLLCSGLLRVWGDDIITPFLPGPPFWVWDIGGVSIWHTSAWVSQRCHSIYSIASQGQRPGRGTRMRTSTQMTSWLLWNTHQTSARGLRGQTMKTLTSEEQNLDLVKLITNRVRYVNADTINCIVWYLINFVIVIKNTVPN